MKVEVRRRVLVKPCNPTPSHLRTYKISIIDELNPSMHVMRILHFPSSSQQDFNHLLDCSLEESLAQVLPRFYPLAGRYNRDHHHVDCNDQGADFSEARISDCRLSHLIGAPDSDLLNQLLPLDICAADDPTDPMLAIRINRHPYNSLSNSFPTGIISRFDCGGLAIGVCASHRIFDSASLGIFLTAWANASIGGPLIIRPDFDIATYFPSEKLPPLQFQVSRTRDRSVVSKMFRFNKKTIASLRETLAAEWESTGIGRPPSRVVAVSAVLTQALLRADTIKHGRQRASLIAQAINVRGRTVPPVSEHSCGTWVSLSYLEFDERESGALAVASSLPAMATKMRESSIQGVRDCARILNDREFGRRVLVDTYFEAAEKADGSDYKVVWVTDWSKFGDYELDFGFGQPVWVSLCDVPLKDMFILMNTKDNEGIEAWVYLHESDMPYFEKDEYIRHLTTPLSKM